MKLKHYLKHLHKIIELNPEALEHMLITADDDAGTSFTIVKNLPTEGLYCKEKHTLAGSDKPNTICLN